MPLRNFGSILNFAIELEGLDQDFYTSAGDNPLVSEQKAMLEDFVAEKKKNRKLLVRARQESITEMILEEIENFSRSSFLSERDLEDATNQGDILRKSAELEDKAILFYFEAAEKLKGTPEVSRLFRSIGKKHKRRKEQLIEQIG